VNSRRKKHAVFCVVFFMTMAGLLLIRCGLADQSEDRLRILICNDDGIEAPGIAALFEAVSQIAQVTVAAPPQNYSGAGHSMNFERPISVGEFEAKGSKWYAIDSPPATCVRLALQSLLHEKPDLVISGINKGENTGIVTFYSATVACAREAAFAGIPSIAFSLESSQKMEYGDAAVFAASLISELRARGFPKDYYLNVNYPALPLEKVKGVRIVRQDTRQALDYYEKRTNPLGSIYFYPLYDLLDAGKEETDIWALKNGFVSVTPMSVDQSIQPPVAGLEFLRKLTWNSR